MTTLATPGQVLPSKRHKKAFVAVKFLGFATLLGVAVFFVVHYVFFYYLNYNKEAFSQAAPHFWRMRGSVMLHITGGMTALLTGPWQFWTGFRVRFARLHRWMGRIFLCAVASSSVGAFGLVFTSSAGWAFLAGLFALAVAWLTTAGMAYYAIRRRRIAIHKEWMVRAYVVTFAFVTFRLITDYPPTSHLQPQNDLNITAAWACWAVPLLATEVILQLRRMRTSAQV